MDYVIPIIVALINTPPPCSSSLLTWLLHNHLYKYRFILIVAFKNIFRGIQRLWKNIKIKGVFDKSGQFWLLIVYQRVTLPNDVECQENADKG